MNAWLDISIPMKKGLPPWPGDRPFHREITSEIGVDGAQYNLSALSMSSHTGTHVDAPKHFIQGGSGVDAIELDILIGPAYVLDMSGKNDHISAADLATRIPDGTQRLLIKTRNSLLSGDCIFHADFLALTLPAAKFIVENGIRLLGIDAFSIAPYDTPLDVHRVFLGSEGAVALENIDLSKAQQGWYDLVCLPLPVAGGDGSPARALIRKREV